MKIIAFGTPLMDLTGLVRLPWSPASAATDTLPLLLDVALESDDAVGAVVAEVWTNAGETAHPERYRAEPMHLVEVSEGTARFALELPVACVGNFRAAARARTTGEWTWASQSGVEDVRFRPRDVRHRALVLEEVSVAHVNWDPIARAPGTFADMLDGGGYTLASLAARGVTGVWLMPPFPVHLWDRRHALDDLGSPYAVKDYFSVREGLTRARGRDAALTEVRAFIAEAHALGIRVILDVALNHVGHEHLIDGESIERSSPWMLASRHGDPRGARGPDDKIAGGFGEWPDTAQLNHGRVRESYRVWRDLEPLPEHRAVQAFLERVLVFWVDIGVDGFRLDHLSGLPASMLEGTLNRVHAASERTLFIVGEDFHTSSETRHFVDAVQGGFFRDLLAVRAPADLERVLADPWFDDVLCLSTHDEPRPIVVLGDDTRAACRLHALLLLAGGPVSMVAGDHLGERVPLPFKRSRGVEALRAPSRDGRAMAAFLAQVARARRDVTALHSEWRAFLRPVNGGTDPELLAMARFSDVDDRTDASVAIVVASFANEGAARTQTFALDDESRHRLGLGARGGRVPLRDLVTDEASACAIVDGALEVTLAPHQVLVLGPATSGATRSGSPR